MALGPLLDLHDAPSLLGALLPLEACLLIQQCDEQMSKIGQVVADDRLGYPLLRPVELCGDQGMDVFTEAHTEGV